MTTDIRPAARPALQGSAQSVSFDVQGDLVQGTFYVPAGASASPRPVVVLAHGWAMNAGGDLEEYAAAIVNRGFAALTFDFRNLGRSEGLPRQELDPFRQIEDIRAAISYVRGREEVDAGRVGLWGSSYSGGHALTVAAIDRRVKCVVSQVPTISGFRAAQRRVRPDRLVAQNRAFEADREARFRGAEPAKVTLIDADPEAAVAYPGQDSYDYMGGEAKRCPHWVNAVTLRSIEMARMYEPGAFIRRIAPTPLLMIVASEDLTTPTDLQQDAFNEAHQPKRLLVVPGGHYSVYTDHFERTSNAAAEWFAEHLL